MDEKYQPLTREGVNSVFSLVASQILATVQCEPSSARCASSTIRFPIEPGDARGARPAELHGPGRRGHAAVGVVNTAFATPFQALVEDSSSNPVAGASVSFDAAPVGFPAPTGTFNGVASVTVQTDASGIATAPTFTANTYAGTETVTASVAGGASANFDLTNLPGPPAKVQGGVQEAFPPQYATLGTAFTQPLTVYVRDAYDNFVGAGANVTFTAPANGASGTFPGGVTSVTVTTAADSTATAPTLTANGIPGSYVVTASVPAGITTGDFDQQNVSSNPVIDQPANSRYNEADLSFAGGVGSVSFSYSGLPWFKSILTGLSSLAYYAQNSGTNYLVVTLPSSGPLLPGPVGFNVLGGSGILTINGAKGPVVTQPGSFTVGGQTFVYTGMPSISVPGATAINAGVVPLYPPPEDVFVKYYIYGQGFTKFPHKPYPGADRLVRAVESRFSARRFPGPRARRPVVRPPRGAPSGNDVRARAGKLPGAYAPRTMSPQAVRPEPACSTLVSRERSCHRDPGRGEAKQVRPNRDGYARPNRTNPPSHGQRGRAGPPQGILPGVDREEPTPGLSPKSTDGLDPFSLGWYWSLVVGPGMPCPRRLECLSQGLGPLGRSGTQRARSLAGGAAACA
jgi:hypothetical protein